MPSWQLPKVIHWPVEVSRWRRWWRELERGPSLVSLLWWLWNIPWGCWCFWPDHSDLYASGWPRWGSRGHLRYSRICHRSFLWTVSTVLSARLIHGLLLVSAWGCCMHKGRQFSSTWMMVMQSEPGEQISSFVNSFGFLCHFCQTTLCSSLWRSPRLL